MIRSSVLLTLALTLPGAAACKKSGTGSSPSTGEDSAVLEKRGSRLAVVDGGGASAQRDVGLWTRAKDEEPEDLTVLAEREGAVGLVEAMAESELRKPALSAMGFAPGYAQLPTLAEVAAGASEEEAARALASAVELGRRPRRQVDEEDATELKEGCERLGVLARDGGKPKSRRILAINAVRTLPCPEVALPGDLDAR